VFIVEVGQQTAPLLLLLLLLIVCACTSTKPGLGYIVELRKWKQGKKKAVAAASSRKTRS
jgi:hypothetical protein